MTPLSRRAFTTVALASLLAGCRVHGGGGEDATAGSSGSRRHRPSAKSGQLPRRSVPVGLRIPAIGINTALLRLGLAPDGSVQVPPITAHDRAGWYEHSPAPGQIGPSVILGHVTVGTYGDGVFRHLSRLHRGDQIKARLENRTEAVFAVSAVRTVAKADFPADDVYGDVDRPELRLITCGGPRTGDEYRDNVIVFAELSATTP